MQIINFQVFFQERLIIIREKEEGAFAGDLVYT